MGLIAGDRHRSPFGFAALHAFDAHSLAEPQLIQNKVNFPLQIARHRGLDIDREVDTNTEAVAGTWPILPPKPINLSRNAKIAASSMPSAIIMASTAVMVIADVIVSAPKTLPTVPTFVRALLKCARFW